MIPKDYRRLCVYPLSLLDRKAMVYPSDPSNSSFFVIDPDSPLSLKDISILYYPKANDVVRVNTATRTSPMLVLAKDIHQLFHCQELRQVRGCVGRFCILPRIITVYCRDVLCLVPHRTSAGCIYIDSN